MRVRTRPVVQRFGLPIEPRHGATQNTIEQGTQPREQKP
jgi:hypothetical protein